MQSVILYYLLYVSLHHTLSIHCCQGDGVGGARVYVDGEEVTSTDSGGHYQLLNITTGRYNIKVGLYVPPVQLW